MKIPRGRPRRLAIVSIVVLCELIARWVEQRRIDTPLATPAGTAAAVRLDAARLFADVQTLSSDRFEGRRNGTEGAQRAATYVRERFQSLGLATFNGEALRPFTFVHTSIKALLRRDRPFRKDMSGVNVIGYTRGRRQPDDYIVVSAHYDHLGQHGRVLYPGADDNASGVAALLAIAEYVQQHPPEHSVIFAAFDAEELDLRGAYAFMASAPVARDRLRVDLNMDMISRGDHRRLLVAGLSHYPALRPIVLGAARAAAVPLHAGHDRPFYWTGLVEDWTHASDHGAFHDAGVPFLYFGVEDHPDYHTPNDTADRIDRRFFAGAAELVLDVLLRIDASTEPSFR
jgi:Zn-dependent M28 family amino/carboxypeptidase